ncbi:hypothetical protein LTR09_007972 [Extremus antarcticus]|uniref:Uncharacterized protein n=1 Tax=Extremus antarcticus TaxID=702011 RepID=A0AAJ0GAS8_9PEZI|nr:hypothetical protein LTR09_007972 [Extremus antarcticus]
MASSYFTLPSFARAKKNKEDLEKTNPQEPVLKDEDEKFLEKHISTDEAAKAQQSDDATATKITDDGEVKEVSKEEAGGDVIVPETQPESNVDGGDGAADAGGEQAVEQKEEQNAEGGAEQTTEQTMDQTADPAADDPSYDDKMKEKGAEAKKARKAKKGGMDLPSQEEAEAATRGFGAEASATEDKSQGEKRTWKSYIASVRPASRKGNESTAEKLQDQPSKESPQTTEGKGESTDQQSKAEGEASDQQSPTSSRTWTQYATSIVPPMPTIPSIPTSWKPKKADPDAQPQPVYNEDGTINDTETAAQQEREVSVLLDNLNLSSINNRVFPLTAETQKYYERFAQCLKDSINGVPTAYEDMDKLMKEAGPRLEQQFKSMPPFVQTLVKSLPAKMGGVVGPELFAIAGDKPRNDMKTRMEAASRPGTTDSGISLPSGSAEKSEVAEGEDGKKKKRTIPGLKSLVGEKSAVAGMLRSAVTFLQTRFPLLASTTNVVMSLAVFILMFVFWYCHKRGKEVRLAREAAEAEGGDEAEIEEVETSDEEEDGEQKTIEEKGAPEDKDDAEAQPGDDNIEREINEKADALSQPNPSEVLLPGAEGAKQDASAGEQKTDGQ